MLPFALKDISSVVKGDYEDDYQRNEAREGSASEMLETELPHNELESL